jgi:hypothetical protein
VQYRDIAAWILGSFSVSSQFQNEFKFPCPRCRHQNFYFNSRKQIGFCHRDSCHWKPTLQDLIDIIGHSPDMAGYIPSLDNKEEKTVGEVTLPKGCWLIVDRNLNADNSDIYVFNALAYRGVPNSVTSCCDFYADKESIIIPVHQDRKLVQYVRRFIDRNKEPKDCFNVEGRRYDYFSGVPITNFLYRWDTHKHTSKQLTLVENTFNALAYDHEEYPFSTNFGSHLSDTQVNLIVRSRIRTVVVMWDEGANSQKAVIKLRNAGVRACPAFVKGQPDDHPEQKIRLLSQFCHRELLLDAGFPGYIKPLYRNGWIEKN